MITKQQIEIDGIPIEIIRKPIKNMHLRIYPPDGLVCVSAPLKLNLQFIHKQLEAKSEWIHKQRAKFKSLPLKSIPILETGESHYFLGIPYTLTLVHEETAKKITLKDNLLLLHTKPNETIINKKAILNHWYLSQMKELIPNLISKWQPIIGVHVGGFGIKAMKTRWGSCNTRTRKICLNLVLIQKPVICLEYVLVHEMVHLHEASHNARFYQLMDKFMPEWRSYKNILRS